MIYRLLRVLASIAPVARIGLHENLPIESAVNYASTVWLYGTSSSQLCPQCGPYDNMKNLALRCETRETTKIEECSEFRRRIVPYQLRLYGETPAELIGSA